MSKMKKSKGSKKARRSAARLAAVQTVYQMSSSGHKSDQAGRDFLDHYAGMELDGEIMLEPDKELFSKIIRGVEDKHSDLRTILRQALEKSDQPSDIDLKKEVELLLDAILLCGIYELLSHHDIDPPIIISDYINVTHSFYGKNEAGLVNAILDRISCAIRDEI